MNRRHPDAQLVLEDGRRFVGRRFGSQVDADGEVVFNTAMTGYQEILTDPSYAGQIVVMSYPQIGNYGIARADAESRKPFLSALIVKECSRICSNWRAAYTLDQYLAARGIPGLEGIDTRMFVRHLRSRGAMRGVLGSIDIPAATLIERARNLPSMAGRDLASQVSQINPYAWDESSIALSPDWQQRDLFAAATQPQFHVVVLDYGVKWNILRSLVDVGCRVSVVPARTDAEQILSAQPDGVLLSNGPGDPDPLDYAVANIRQLLGRVPIFGICLGHQLLGLACGARTYKLKFGHRGSNHPVLDTASRRVEITAHNHGFAVDADSLGSSRAAITHINLNDQTVEGLRLLDVPAFSVQYHPEAAPGPHDAHYLFLRFADLMREFRGEKSTHAPAL
ncbi:MAG: glutamine-hydrolyzing carbamoyl-phosphate synthase small subunit [candidate division Zixibacteria bacterium]|nr:glutamine-hydrolyzing carbamoyl-phosphate synthase small subunit [candidate division Zixibacteria bacterium]